MRGRLHALRGAQLGTLARVATFLLAILLTTAPEPTNVLVPDFAAEGLSAAAAGALVERFAAQLGEAKTLKVQTSGDLARVLGIERQKALLGCGETDGSCLAELAGAMGTGVLIAGTVVKVGSRFTVSLRALRLPGGEPLTAESARVDGEDALSDWLDQRAIALRQLLAPSAAAPPPVPVSRWAPWLVVGLGGVTAVTGGVFYGLSRGDVAHLEKPTAETDVDAVVLQGKSREALGMGLLLGGGATVAAGLLWAFLAPKSPLVVSLGPGGVTLVGVLP